MGIKITGGVRISQGSVSVGPTDIPGPVGPQLWAWGDNSPNGQLGDETIIDKSSPIQVGALVDWSIVEAGSQHVAAIKTDNTLWAWGRNNLGQVGDNTTTNRSSPVQIGLETIWNSATAGSYRSLAIKTTT